jgi:hypothetical protein
MTGEHDFIELEGCLSDGGSNVARPGDTLIIHIDRQVSMDQAAAIRAAVIGRIPGLGDVLVLTCTGTTIYRPDPA